MYMRIRMTAVALLIGLTAALGGCGRPPAPAAGAASTGTSVSCAQSAALTTIPQCVLGGATVAVFSTIAMTGMKLISAEGITARNTTIVGLSAALGVGISQASAALAQFPEAVTTIFGKSPVVIATLMAVFLNLILPKEET